MGLYTSSYLKSLYRKDYNTISRAIVNESFTSTTEYDIFLSHSYLDKEEIGGLYTELKSLGYSVYVDWIVDSQLDRNNVTKSTANLIRTRMNASKCILLATSTHTTSSKWIPWELGYMDGKTHKCAILPVDRSGNNLKSFRGYEFLSLYPFIKKVPTRAEIDRLFVIEEAFKYVIFDDWLKKSILPFEREDNIFTF